MSDTGPPGSARPFPRIGAALILIADLSATFLFAAEGALTAALARLDPIGVLVIAFVSGLGGGVIRDLLIAEGRPAAVANWRYTPVVLAGAIAGWSLVSMPWVTATPAVVTLDAMGLALGAVAGTEKALNHRVHPVVSVFVGGLGGVGGGMIRDLLLNNVPRVLHTDVYATAALLAAVVVVAGRQLRFGARRVALFAALSCFVLRMLAWHFGWSLPGANQS